MSDARPHPAPHASGASLSGSSGTVLVVEDDPDIAEGLRYNLERAGLDVRVALTGEEGLCASLAPDGPPSLVILDLLLPGMNGIELCRRLRREAGTRGTPIIMLTACDAPKSVEAAREAGADEYFIKPFSVHELIEQVHKFLGRSGG